MKRKSKQKSEKNNLFCVILIYSFFLFFFKGCVCLTLLTAHLHHDILELLKGNLSIAVLVGFGNHFLKYVIARILP